MTSVFNYDKIQKVDLKPKQWVRMKTGIYEGDLAQVIAIEDPVNKIYIRIIPRLSESGNKKNKTDVIKPKQRLFNPTIYEQSEVKTSNHPVLRELVYVWNKMSFKDGFLIKSVRVKSLVTENVVPKIEELKIFDFNNFKSNDDGGNIDMDNILSSVVDSELSRKKNFNKGDKVKVIKGGLNNVTGKIISHSNGVVSLIPDINGFTEPIEMPENYLIKLFLPGDLVRVLGGSNYGKFGIIVKIDEDTALIYSESTDTEFKASCHDLVHSTQNVVDTDTSNYFQVGDLVKINTNSTICYVLEVQKHILKLLDTRGEIKSINTRDVSKLTQMYILIILVSLMV
jgi:transcription elongation factor SPT5